MIHKNFPGGTKKLPGATKTGAYRFAKLRRVVGARPILVVRYDAVVVQPRQVLDLMRSATMKLTLNNNETHFGVTDFPASL